MANRYWVGGTASWNATVGTKWALTSGGTGGEAVPTSSDDVFLDANSGASTVTVTSTGNCLSLDCSGFTGTLKNADTITLNIFGNLTLGSAMTFGANSSAVRELFVFAATSTGKTITTNGVSYSGNGQFTFNGVGGGWTLQDNFSMTSIASAGNGIVLTAGSLDTNNKNVTISGLSVGNVFNISGSTARTLTLGSSIISCRTWTATTTTNLTFNANSSTLNVGIYVAGNNSFNGGGLTYNNVTVGFGNVTTTIVGNNTFNILTIAAVAGPATIKFTAGSTQTVTSFVCLGNNTPNILKSTLDGSAWTISIASGTTRITNASLQDSTATGGATFRAENTTDVSGNTGWTFGLLGGFFPFMS